MSVVLEGPSLVIGKYSCINIFISIWVQLVCSLTCFKVMVILRDYYLSLQHMVSLSDHFCFCSLRKEKPRDQCL